MSLFQTFNLSGLFDSHAHLAYSKPEEVLSDIQNAKQSGIEAVFNMGIDLDSSKKVIQQAKESNNYLKAYIGIDPEVFEPGSEMFVGLIGKEVWIEEQINQIKILLEQHPQIVSGIGESGMDYYHFEQNNADLQTKAESKRLQELLFRRHLELAQEFKLPLSIHSRWAEKECLEIVKGFDCQGIFHSYTGDYQTAVKILDTGWGLGVNGIATFKSASQLREVYKKILGSISNDITPLDLYKKGVFFETDSPFLAPEGKRGERNQPAYIKIIFDKFINSLK